ncbi:MAG: hypothetical protein AAF621_06755 [Pseudomonadota bacterium]
MDPLDQVHIARLAAEAAGRAQNREGVSKASGTNPPVQPPPFGGADPELAAILAKRRASADREQG